MIRYVILVAALGFIVLRLAMRSGALGRPRRRAPRPAGAAALGSLASRLLGETAIVVEREVRERFRGRIFRFGTLLVVAAVVLSIVIPTLGHKGATTERIGVVGTLPAALRSAVVGTGSSIGVAVRLVSERDVAAARADLRTGRIGLAILGGRAVESDTAIQSTDTSTTARLARAVATTLGVDEAMAAAGLSPAQAAELGRARPLPVTSLRPGSSQAARTAALVGLPLLFFLFVTYNSWILTGVMEEKSSRVVEVLLASVRPLQLLSGKVIGIGIVALTQAAVIVGATLVAAKAAGSSIASGTSPLFLGAVVAWLLVGYSFYCWVYAAAGSMAERRDQVQGLLVPLNLPLILGYVVALTAQRTGTPSLLVKVLAYLPPTAPFAMPALVGIGAVTWWEFAASIALTIVCTAGVARFAANVYRRAILRTGQRVRLRDVLAAEAG